MRRLIFSMIFVAVSGHGALADDKADWEQRIRQHYKHYSKIEVMDGGLRTFSPCGDKLEDEFHFEPWTLWLRLTSTHDENLFFKHFRVGVRKVAPGVDAMKLWEKASKDTRCMASYANEAVVQVGDYVVRLDATCSEMHKLFPYEVADLLQMAGKTDGQMVYDRCGNMDITFRPVSEVLSDAKKPGKLYQHKLPDDRERAKSR